MKIFTKDNKGDEKNQTPDRGRINIILNKN